MQIRIYTEAKALESEKGYSAFKEFVKRHPDGNFFQTSGYFDLMQAVEGFKPFQIVAWGEDGNILGSLCGTIQSFGKGLKSWMSRRALVMGGPLVDGPSTQVKNDIAAALLSKLKKYTKNKAIYVEFRNMFDMSDLHASFDMSGFEYQPHLNFLLKLESEEDVWGKLSRSRAKEIRQSLKKGGRMAALQTEEELKDFYDILNDLYLTKVKKPLVGFDFFKKFWEADLGKIFIIKLDGKVVGGSLYAEFEKKMIYEWYACSVKNQQKNFSASALATWVGIDYGLKSGYKCFDFMGAGKPDEAYGVREFKSRFGGDMVSFGRYHTILNKPLYQAARLGFTIYQKLM